MKSNKRGSAQVTVLTIIGIILAIIGIIIITQLIIDSIGSFSTSESESDKKIAMKVFNDVVSELRDYKSIEKTKTKRIAFQLDPRYQITISRMQVNNSVGANVKLIYLTKITDSKFDKKIVNEKFISDIQLGVSDDLTDFSFFDKLNHNPGVLFTIVSDKLSDQYLVDEDAKFDFSFSLCGFKDQNDKIYVFLPKEKKQTGLIFKTDNTNCYANIINEAAYKLTANDETGKVSAFLNFHGIKDPYAQLVKNLGEPVQELVKNRSLYCVFDDSKYDYPFGGNLMDKCYIVANKSVVEKEVYANKDLKAVKILYAACKVLNGDWDKHYVYNIQDKFSIDESFNEYSKEMCEFDYLNEDYNNFVDAVKWLMYEDAQDYIRKNQGVSFYTKQLESYAFILSYIKDTPKDEMLFNYFTSQLISNPPTGFEAEEYFMGTLFQNKEEFIDFLKKNKNKEFNPHQAYNYQKITDAIGVADFLSEKTKLKNKCNEYNIRFNEVSDRRDCYSNSALDPLGMCFWINHSVWLSDSEEGCFWCDIQKDCKDYTYKRQCEATSRCRYVGEEICHWYDKEGDDPAGCYPSVRDKTCSDITGSSECNAAICFGKEKCCIWDGKCRDESEPFELIKETIKVTGRRTLSVG